MKFIKHHQLMNAFNESSLLIEPLNNSIIDSSANYGLEQEKLYQEGQNYSQYNQILFIDSTVKDYQTLIDNLNRPSEVVILDSQRDGIVQITNSLSKYDSLDAVHIVSHGDAGKLFLGNAVLDSISLSDYANELDSWNNFIEEDGDILLYGCNVASGEDGLYFMEELSQATNAGISASIDYTGQDGDWELEAKVGDVETTSIFDSNINTAYQHTLTDLVFIVDRREEDDDVDDSFDDAFNDQIDRELFSSGGDDEVDASDFDSFANVPANNLVNLAEDGLNFAEVNPNVLATIDFIVVPINFLMV